MSSKLLRAVFPICGFILCVVVAVSCKSGSSGNSNPSDPSDPDNPSDPDDSISCPTGFIEVPALTGYTDSDFCVMRYEAKAQLDSDDSIVQNGCDGTGVDCTGGTDDWAESTPATPVSVAEGVPWRHISRDNAIAECQSLGTGYDLITNDEWQTIARNIEGVASNWSGSTVGSGSLNHGHGDADPDIPCDSEIENVGTDCETLAASGWDAEKRTHTLSTGEEIWDLAGNINEFVKDDFNSLFTVDASDIHADDTADLVEADSNYAAFVTSDIKDSFGPSGDYSSFAHTGHRGGLGQMRFLISVSPETPFSVKRGGLYSHAAFPNGHNGVFYVHANRSVTLDSDEDDGFRCVYHP